jgi:hypothetical protein
MNVEKVYYLTLFILAMLFAFACVTIGFGQDNASSYAKGFQVRSIDKQWRV